MRNIKKVGEVNFGKFKTEFFITKKVEEYLNKEGVSLSTLLPNGWKWYEVYLFEAISKNGKPDKKYGDNFKVIYFGIIEEKTFEKERGFADKIQNFGDKELLREDIEIKSTPKNPDKNFYVKYILIQK